MNKKVITINIITKISSALRTDLDNLIFIGGTAVFLYHRKLKTHSPLYTYDIDTLVTKPCSLRKKIEEIGFVELPARGRGKSCGKFVFDTKKLKSKVIKIELLLPMVGKSKYWGIIEKGLEAEKLRYLDILIDNFWKVKVDRNNKINIPHPARYIIQKLLSYDKRKAIEEKEKDAAYIADILNLFFDKLNMIIEEISKIN